MGCVHVGQWRLGSLGLWDSGASEGTPTPLCLFPVAQRCLHYGWPLCSANSPHIVSFCLFKIICLFIIILARNLLPLVLPVTPQREFQNLYAFTLPRPFSPLIVFLKSISFWCIFMSYSSWKWKEVLDITKKDVILGQYPTCPESTLGSPSLTTAPIPLGSWRSL